MLAKKKRSVKQPETPPETPILPPPASPFAKIVDEIGALERELEPAKPKIARLDLLRKALRSFYEDKPAASSFLAQGERFDIAVGAKAYETVVNVPKLFKEAGAALFMKIVSVTKKALESQVSPEIAMSVLSTEQTGTRTLKVVEKGQAAA